VRSRRPFTVDAIVVLPDHLHGRWTLPSDDVDYSTRWRLIKSMFARQIPVGERLSKRREVEGERGIWQRRLWAHAIRDEADFARLVDGIHFNPVKHGHVEQVADWPYSSFHCDLQRGVLPADWAADAVVSGLALEQAARAAGLIAEGVIS